MSSWRRSAAATTPQRRRSYFQTTRCVATCRQCCRPQSAETAILPRLVYQGTLSTNGGHYDLRAIFRSIVSEGVSLDVYPSRAVPAYAELAVKLDGLRVHRTLPPSRLLAALPSYDFGWAGFNSRLNGAHLDTCLPNKAYEYVGCGLPVLTLRHRALARLVGDGHLGLSLATLDDLLAQLACGRRGSDALPHRGRAP